MQKEKRKGGRRRRKKALSKKTIAFTCTEQEMAGVEALAEGKESVHQAARRILFSAVMEAQKDPRHQTNDNGGRDTQECHER